MGPEQAYDPPTEPRWLGLRNGRGHGREPNHPGGAPKSIAAAARDMGGSDYGALRERRALGGDQVTGREPPSAGSTWRWTDPFKVRAVWLPPVVLVVILIVVMTLVYFGSVVNPTGHLHGLPVSVVDRDTGVSVGGQRVDFGRQLTAGLIGSPAVASHLKVRASSVGGAGIARRISGAEH